MLVHRLTCTHSFKTHSSLPVLATPWKSNTWVWCNPQIQGKDKTNCHQFCIELLPFQRKLGLTWMLPLSVSYLHTDIEVFSLSHRKFRYFQTDICSTSIKQVLPTFLTHHLHKLVNFSKELMDVFETRIVRIVALCAWQPTSPPPPHSPTPLYPPMCLNTVSHCYSGQVKKTLIILHRAIQLNCYCYILYPTLFALGLVNSNSTPTCLFSCKDISGTENTELTNIQSSSEPSLWAWIELTNIQSSSEPSLWAWIEQPYLFTRHSRL